MSHEENEKVSVLSERLKHTNELILALSAQLAKFQELADARFVTRVEFTPIQKLVYGGLGIVMSMVLAGLMGLVLIHK